MSATRPSADNKRRLNDCLSGRKSGSRTSVQHMTRSLPERRSTTLPPAFPDTTSPSASPRDPTDPDTRVTGTAWGLTPPSAAVGTWGTNTECVYSCQSCRTQLLDVYTVTTRCHTLKMYWQVEEVVCRLCTVCCPACTGEGGERAWTMHDGKMEMTEIETGTQYVSVGDRETKSHRQWVETSKNSSTISVKWPESSVHKMFAGWVVSAPA